MAKRRRRRRFGGSAEFHREGAKSNLRELRRLARTLRSKLKDPPDCFHAAHLVRTMMQNEGAILIDRYWAGGKGATRGAGAANRALFDRFVKVCVVHPKNRRASQRIHSVWR